MRCCSLALVGVTMLTVSTEVSAQENMTENMTEGATSASNMTDESLINLQSMYQIGLGRVLGLSPGMVCID